MKTLIFHGTHGAPTGNWFPWLQDHLMQQEWQVAVPKLPTPEGQSLDSWKTALSDQISGFSEADILIGHSLGGTFALRLLEQGLVTPKTIILASCVTKNINNEEYDTLNNSFIAEQFDWDKIKRNSTDIIILHGDNDPYVPLEHAQELAENLEVTLHIIKDGGHLNAENGYTNFSEILDFLNV